MNDEVQRYRERIKELGYLGDGQDWFSKEMRKGTITPEEFERRMRLIEDVFGGDPEDTHMAQDDLMLEVLRQNGYAEGVKVFYESGKWYA